MFLTPSGPSFSPHLGTGYPPLSVTPQGGQTPGSHLLRTLLSSFLSNPAPPARFIPWATVPTSRLTVQAEESFSIPQLKKPFLNRYPGPGPKGKDMHQLRLKMLKASGEPTSTSADNTLGLFRRRSGVSNPAHRNQERFPGGGDRYLH